MEGAVGYIDDGCIRFRCRECLQVMPAQYRSPTLPSGWESPVCVMCVNYSDALQDRPNVAGDREKG